MKHKIANTGVAIFMALAASGGAWAESCDHRLLFELPMAANELGSPVVPIKIDGQPRDVLLDTGGFWSMIQPSIAKRYKHRRSKVDAWLGLQGIHVDTAVDVPSVQIGPTTVPHVDFFEEPPGFSDYPATLGANWLSRFDVEIDPVKDQALFYTPSRCGDGLVDWPHSDVAQLAVKIDPGVNLMTVPVVLDGETIDALIDTGAVETYISRDVADRLFGVDTDNSSEDDNSYRRQFHSLRLGTLNFADPWLVVTQISVRGPQMILGMHQLRGLHLFFAYSRRTLYATTARGDIAARQAAAPADASAAGLHDPTAAISARDYLRTAEKAMKRKDLSGALAAADRAVQSDPAYAQAYVERGDLYRRQGVRDRAIDDMQHAITLDPMNSMGILSLSELYLTGGDPARAMDEANRGIQLAPRDGLSYAVRAEAYAAQGLMDRALMDSIVAIRLDPGAVTGYLSRSHIHELGGDYSRAFDFADKAVAVNPKSALALNARCWSGALLGRLDGALRDCDQAVALLPYNSEILDSRGFVHLKAGRADMAIADFTAALAINPRLASSLYGRGLARRQNGEVAVADADIAAAVAADPDIAKHFGK